MPIQKIIKKIKKTRKVTYEVYNCCTGMIEICKEKNKIKTL